MNEFLNNVFTAESVSAIKNAHVLAPSPEQRGEVVYSNVKMTNENIIENKPVESSGAVSFSDLKELKNALVKEIIAQSERITTIIASQNQMIKEFNDLCAKVEGLEKRSIASVSKEEQVPVSTPAPEVKPQATQQTGAGEGLNPKDYSVEDIFYFGKK